MSLPLTTICCGEAAQASAVRHLCLSAVPHSGMVITSMDIDLTVDCNLRCIYCFKEKRAEAMPKRVAFDAVIWLLYASGGLLFKNTLKQLKNKILLSNCAKERIVAGKKLCKRLF